MEIGIDCVNISRFDAEISSNHKFLEKIFTQNEIVYCKKKAKSSQHFAVRFAGKEAVIKALSHYDVNVPFNQIEISNDERGIPSVRLLNDDLNHFDIKISLSHSIETAMAVALVSKDSVQNNLPKIEGDGWR